MPTYKRGSYTGRHNNKNHTDTNNSVKIQRKIYCEHMVKTAKEQRKLQKEEGKESMPTPLQDVVIWALTSVLISRDFVLTEEYFYDPQYQETGIMTVTKLTLHFIGIDTLASDRLNWLHPQLEKQPLPNLWVPEHHSG